MAAFPKCFYQFCSDAASAADDYDFQFLIHMFSFLHCVFSRHFVRCCDAWQTAEYHTICHRALSSHCLSRCRLTLLQKLEQVRIHPLGVGCGYAVWRARIVDFLRAFDQLRGFLRRVFDGNDLIVFPVQDERWYVEFFQILRLIRLRKRLDAFVGVQQAGLHAP